MIVRLDLAVRKFLQENKIGKSYNKKRVETMTTLPQVEVEINDLLSQLPSLTEKDEATKDAILGRLRDLATFVEGRFVEDPGSVSRRLKEVVVRTKAHSLGPTIVHTHEPVLYDDPYELFASQTPSVKLVALTAGLSDGPETGSDRNLIRNRLRSAIFKPDRSQWLEEATDGMCAKCKATVLPELFSSVMQMLMLTLKERQAQVQEWLQKRMISVLDHKHILNELSVGVREASALLDEVAKSGVQSASIEKAFGIIIRVLNEMMFRYVQTERIKQSVNG